MNPDVPAAAALRLSDSRPAAASSTHALSALAIRLAAGDARAASEVSTWPSLFDLMRRERLAAVAWLRCGERIRALADPRTAALWRSLWADSVSRGSAALEAYADAADVLARHGVGAIALKGPTLAELLYGDPTARCSDDVDCYVPAADRIAAERVLRAQGWTVVLGSAAGDQTFARTVGGHTVRLELHSLLVSERLAHLPVPAPEQGTRMVGGRSLSVFMGPLLPAYLAAHLATHFAPPLLWWLDFAGVWGARSAAERADSRRVAQAAGLGRYLTWAVRGAAAVEQALGGDGRALSRLGVRADGRRDRHELWRHLLLAPDAAAGARALAAWVRPPWAAARDGGVILGTLRRVRRHWRRLLPGKPASTSTVSASPPPATAKALVTLDGAALLSVAREITSAGGELHVALTGRSMVPTLEPGDRLVLGTIPARLPAGCIVLAEVQGRPVVHRVSTSLPDGTVGMRGDACREHDSPVSRDEVAACLVASERAGVWCAHTLTLRFGVQAAARGVRFRIRARLAHLWRALRAACVSAPAATSAARTAADGR